MRHIVMAGMLTVLMLAAVVASSASPLKTLVASLWLLGSGITGIAWIFRLEKRRPTKNPNRS